MTIIIKGIYGKSKEINCVKEVVPNFVNAKYSLMYRLENKEYDLGEWEEEIIKIYEDIIIKG